MTKEQASVSSSSEEYVGVLSSSSPQPIVQRATNHSTTDDISIEARAMRPPRLLLTLLGDYWWQRNEQLPSAALVTLLTEFGITDTAARAALSRLVSHNLLVTSKHGRQTFYRLSERAMHVLNDGALRIFSFGREQRPWDGMWSLVAFSIPEEKRQLRYVLRDRLRWLGFAPLYDGLWISPRDSLSDAAVQLAELSIKTATIFRARVITGIPEACLPQQAWDLDALRAQYQQFISVVQPLGVRIKNGMFSPEEALKLRTRIMDSWRRFPAMDPDLPVELLPADWPRTRARQLFIEIYDELGPLAQQRVRQIIARYAPALAEIAMYYRSDSWFASEAMDKSVPS